MPREIAKFGVRPREKLDKRGNETADRIYKQKDFDRTLTLEKRTELAPVPRSSRLVGK